MIRKYFFAALAALSITSAPALAQTQVAAGASSSSTSTAAAAASGTGGNATINNARQLIPGSAIAVAPPPTAMCQKTHAAGISVPFFGVSFGGSKGDKECYWYAMHDREEDGAMRCQLRYNHSADERSAAADLGYAPTYCRPQPVAVAPPPPPPVVMAPPPQIIERVVTRTVVRYVPRPVHRHVVKRAKPACASKVSGS